MNRKKILIFLQDGVGGAERMSVLIGKELPKEQFDVRFYLVERGSKSSIADFIPKGYYINRISKGNPLKMMWRFFRAIAREKPHVVFSSVMYLNTKILPFSKFFPKTRFIVRCENYLYTFNKKQHHYIRLTYHIADTIIAQTQEMADELIEQMNIAKEKVVVLQNPVDTKLIDNLTAETKNPYPNDGKKHLVASGRFAYQKGYDLLIDAFFHLLQKDVNADLYIIGDKDYDSGNVYKEVMAFAHTHGIDGLIHCVGYQKNPYPFIKYADCFVLSSRWEGLPNVLIEALYLGTPVAAFKCIPVIERIVQEGKNGYMAEKENCQSLVEAMKKTITLGRVMNTYQPATIPEFVRLCNGGG